MAKREIPEVDLFIGQGSVRRRRKVKIRAPGGKVRVGEKKFKIKPGSEFKDVFEAIRKEIKQSKGRPIHQKSIIRNDYNLEKRLEEIRKLVTDKAKGPVDAEQISKANEKAIEDTLKSRPYITRKELEDLLAKADPNLFYADLNNFITRRDAEIVDEQRKKVTELEDLLTKQMAENAKTLKELQEERDKILDDLNDIKKEFEDNKDKSEKDIAKLSQERADLIKKIGDLEKNLGAARAANQNLARQVTETAKQLEQADRESQGRSRELETVRARFEESTDQLRRSAAEISKLNAELHAVRKQVDNVNRAVADARADIQKERDAKEAAESKAAELQAEKDRIESDKRKAEEEKKRRDAEKEEAKKYGRIKTEEGRRIAKLADKLRSQGVKVAGLKVGQSYDSPSYIKYIEKLQDEQEAREKESKKNEEKREELGDSSDDEPPPLVPSPMRRAKNQESEDPEDPAGSGERIELPLRKSIFDYTTESELNRFGRNINGYLGTCCSDEILDYKDELLDSEFPMNFLIVNTLKRDSPPGEMGHWTALATENNLDDGRFTVMYYDPLGHAASENLILTLRKLVSDQPFEYEFKENLMPSQSPDSKLCGFHCLNLINVLSNGVPWASATHFSKKINQHESIARQLARSVQQYGTI